ncbi:FAD-binding protein [uncultured Roseibium sp.]|uniref:NAD(P)/FAD-dependent oxidoreductase n=1 Tax=uncultured Roseibium sp. TaxID=1936171 RepID=UPI002610426E|nr:FAD-binding protein [uncultured Roseibium sp.]
MDVLGFDLVCLMKTDVLIVGDGIAGLSSAITTRQKGLETVVLQPYSRPKDTFQVMLHPGVESLFKMLGVDQEVSCLAHSRPDGYWQYSTDGGGFVLYGQDTEGTWLGYLLNLRDLEALLRAKALGLGAIFMKTAGPVHAPMEYGTVKGLEIAGKHWGGDLTIDASGGRGILARDLCLKYLFGSPPLVATCASKTSSNPVSHPVFRMKPDGWRFDICTGQGQHSTISMAITAQKINPKHKSGWDVSWRYLPECAGPGYALVGDSAFRLDPGSGSGVLRAIMMGIKAIELSDKPYGWRLYRQWVSDWAHTDGAALASIYSEKPFNAAWPKSHRWSDVKLSF